MTDVALILAKKGSKGLPGNLVADILEGIIINVFIDSIYLFRL